MYDRNLSCKGCSEKEEFVNAVYENRNVPIVEKTTANDNSNIDPEEEARKDKEIADLMAKLKMQGGFGGNVFNARDLKNMDFDMMKNQGKFKSKEPPRKRSVKKDDDDEKIEL